MQYGRGFFHNNIMTEETPDGFDEAMALLRLNGHRNVARWIEEEKLSDDSVEIGIDHLTVTVDTNDSE